MRKHRGLVKDFLAERMEQKRRGEGLTQEKMSEKLRLTPRSYNNIKLRKNGVSAATLLFLLSLMEEDEVTRLLSEFRSEVQEAEQNEVLPKRGRTAGSAR